MQGRSSTVADRTNAAGITSTADSTAPTSPTQQPCWPDDPYYPDGYTEIDLPSERLLRAAFHAEILEPEGEPQPRIIQADEPFKVRFRLAQQDQLWSDISGDWWFDLGFAPTGAGKGFDLSNLLGRDKLYVRNWRGSDTQCLEREVYVLAHTIPTEYCGTVYQCAAKVQLFCDGKPTAAVGSQVLGSFQFYKADLDEDDDKRVRK
jgi:hypothetical protein